MAGKIDEFSRLLGSLEANLASIKRSIDQDRQIADQRHRQNSDKLDGIGGRVEGVERQIEPLAKAVATMQPIVDGVQVTRLKLAGAISVLALAMALLGWLAAAVAGKAIEWVVAHLR